jgi:hypothetical protein
MDGREAGKETILISQNPFLKRPAEEMEIRTIGPKDIKKLLSTDLNINTNAALHFHGYEQRKFDKRLIGIVIPSFLGLLFWTLYPISIAK